MPELPEVEAARKLAATHLCGHVIDRVHTVDDPIVYDGLPTRSFARALRGRTVLAFHRKGKQMWMETDQPPFALFHFGMTGSFHVYQQPAQRPAYWKIELVMENGTRLAMVNKRRLGRLRLRHDPPNELPISRLGFDPLLEMPPYAAFQQAVRSRKNPIKALLLDQAFAAGVGNWIADEVLYQARIHPARRCHTLTDAEVRSLRTTLSRVIRRAVAVDADDTRFPKGWLFHFRWGKTAGATTADGHPIQFDTIAGRTTAWVPGLQT